MISIGDTLRRERLRLGFGLEKVAAETKIGLHLLEAIEAEQFDRLPGEVFTRSFVRQYARLLGLDDDELLAALRGHFEEPTPPAPPPEPPPALRLPPLEEFRKRLRSDSSLAAFVWVVVAVVACAGAYSFWQKGGRAAPSAATVSAAPKPAPRAQHANLKPGGAVTQPEAAKPDFQPAELSDSGAIRVPAPSPPIHSEPEPGQGVFQAAMRVAFTATEPVWVSVKSDGTRTYTGTIDGHEIRQFDASRKITVLVGNAGGLAISLNGKPVGPIGPRGEIRLLVLTPQGAHVVPRTPPTPVPTSEDSTAPPPEGDRL